MKEEAMKITLSAKVDDETVIDFIAKYAFLFSTVLHNFWKEFIIKEGDFSEIKSSFQVKYGMNSRMLISVNMVAKSKWQTRKTQYSLTIKSYQSKVNMHRDWIRKRKREMDKNLKNIQKIEDYKEMKTCFRGRPKERKPLLTKVLTKVLTKIDVRLLPAENALLKRKIEYKKTNHHACKTWF